MGECYAIFAFGKQQILFFKFYSRRYFGHPYYDVPKIDIVQS